MTFDPGQIPSLLRQNGQVVVGLALGFAVLGTIPAEQAHAAVDAVQQIASGFSKLALIIIPAVSALMSKIAWDKSSFKSKVADVKTVASNPDQPTSKEAKDALQEAVASRPDRMVVAIDPSSPAQAAVRMASLTEVKAVITNPEIAAATPAVPKIISPAEAAAKL